MPETDAALGSFGSVSWLVAVGFVAFAITWLVADVLHVRRTPFIAILMLTVLGVTFAYATWSDSSFLDASKTNVGVGVVGGLVAAAIVFPLVRRLPPDPRSHGGRLAALLAWEGLVYGIAEALLLVTLPVVIVWQAAEPDGASVLWRAAAVGAAGLVTLVHHLGYAEFRQPGARTKLTGALVTCGLQALAFVVTGSLWAPIVAHVVLHAQMLLRGVELPPVELGRVPSGMKSDAVDQPERRYAGTASTRR